MASDINLILGKITYQGNSGIYTLAESDANEVLLSAGTIIYTGETQEVTEVNGVLVTPGTVRFIAEAQEVQLPSYSFDILSYLVKDNLSTDNYTLFPFLALKDHTETQEWLTDIIDTPINQVRFSVRETPRTIYKYRYLLQHVEDYTLIKQLISKYISSMWLVPAWNQVFVARNVTAGVTTLSKTVNQITIDIPNLEIDLDIFCLVYYSRNNFQVLRSTSSDDVSIDFETSFSTSTDSCWIIPLNKVSLLQHSFERNSNNNNMLSCDFLSTNSYIFYPEVVDDIVAQYPIEFLNLSTRLIAILPVRMQDTLEENFTKSYSKVDNLISRPLTLDLEDYNHFNLTFSMVATSREQLTELKNILTFLKGRFTEFLIPSFSSEAKSNTSSLPSTSTFITTDIFYGLSIGRFRFIKIVGNYTHYAQVTSITITAGNKETIQFTPALPTDMTDIQRIEELFLVRSNTDHFEISYEPHRNTTFKAFCRVPLIEVPINI